MATTYDGYGVYDSIVWYDTGLSGAPIVPTMNRDIYINQGQDFSKVFRVMNPATYLPVDITTAVFVGGMKHNIESPALLPFVFEILDGPAGKFKITLTDAETRPLDRLSYMYTIQMTMDGIDLRSHQGTAFVSMGVV
jgi:hypothetical protein